MSNKYDTVLYIGVTNNLERRCQEHKLKLIAGFTKKYNANKLVYYEIFEFIEDAIRREKQLKGLSRYKKDAIINRVNPERKDLFDNGKIQAIE